MGRYAVVVLGLALAGSAHADVAVDPCACSPNKPGFHRASALTGDWNGLRSDLFDEGIKIQATYAGELFAAPGLDSDRLVGAGLGALAIDIDLATLVADHLGALHVGGFAIHGDGLSERLMDVYGVSNNVAPPGVRLFEAWYEQPIGPFSIRAGLIAADQEFVLAEHSTVLLNATFGILAMLSYNIHNPVYPVAAPGASLHVDSDLFSVKAAIYADHDDNHGIPTALGNDALVLVETELAGLVKLGAWHHTDLGDGYYAIVDHQLERYVGTFARFSVAPDSPLSLYVDTGIRIGPGPLRRRDFASIGLAFARTELGAQTIVEATYQYLVRGWLTVQPDAQLLLTRDGTAGVLAARAVVAL
jgi:porin